MTHNKISEAIVQEVQGKLEALAVTKLVAWGKAIQKAESRGPEGQLLHDHEMHVQQARTAGLEAQALALVLAERFG